MDIQVVSVDNIESFPDREDVNMEITLHAKSTDQDEPPVDSRIVVALNTTGIPDDFSYGSRYLSGEDTANWLEDYCGEGFDEVISDEALRVVKEIRS